MTFYPKEGLITLHQSLNPPINEAITIELNKEGFGEFVTHDELNDALTGITAGNINALTTNINHLNEIIDITNILQLPTIINNGLQFKFSGSCIFIAPDTKNIITFSPNTGITIYHQPFQPFLYFYIYYQPLAPESSYITATTDNSDPNRLYMFKSTYIDSETVEITYYKSGIINDIDELKQTILTTEQVNKLNEILPFSIGPNGTSTNTWPNILTVGTDGVTEIGQYLDFHASGNSGYNNLARISLINTGYLSFDGVFTITQVYTTQIYSLNSIFIDTVNNLSIKASGNNPIVTFKNDLSTEFFGEISTPTLNTTGLNTTITNLSSDVLNLQSKTHNTLTQLQGGLTNEYYHLNATDYTELTGRQLLTNSIYQNT